MERYSADQVKRALAQEQLLQRLDRGEDFDILCRELNLSLQPSSLTYLRRCYRQGGCSWQALIDHRHGHPAKVTPERRAWLRACKCQDPALTQAQLAHRFELEFQVCLSQSHVSNLLRAQGVALPGGQHHRASADRTWPMDRAGVFFPPRGRPADGGADDCRPGDLDAAREL